MKGQSSSHGLFSVFHKNNWFQGRAIAAERKHPLRESLRYWPSPNVLKYWLEYWFSRLCNNLSIFVNKILIVETGKKRGKVKHKKRSQPSVYIERSDNPCIQSTRDEYLLFLRKEVKITVLAYKVISMNTFLFLPMEGKALTFPSTPQPWYHEKKFRKYCYSEISGAMGVKGSELAYKIDDKSSDVFKMVKKCKIWKKKKMRTKLWHK